MVPKVLIVDDDPTLLGLLEEELADYDEMFSVRTASGGQEALDLMKNEHFTVVVTDLRMPGVDGFELLNRISAQYIDIPVIAITGFDRPKTREVVLKSGAVDYLTKPVAGAKLASRIIKILKKKSEGGSLHNVTLETYLQLVEMEQQTCTLRISEKSGGRMGVLFFRDGELMDARFGDLKGREAAYEILSWAGVSLSIENACMVQTKQINGELQAILLDAMRNRDESLDVEGELQREEEDDAVDDTILLSEPVDDGTVRKAPSVTAANAATESEPLPSGPAAPELTPVALIRKKLSDVFGNKGGIEDVYSDSQWTGLISQAQAIGAMFDAGALNVICLNQGRTGQLLIVPGDEPIVAALDADISRDRAIGALT